jgi:hypothetical protein
MAARTDFDANPELGDEKVHYPNPLFSKRHSTNRQVELRFSAREYDSN